MSEHDYVWRLEGYDVWLDPHDNAAGRQESATTNVKFTTSDTDGDTFVMPNLATSRNMPDRSGVHADDDVPDALKLGARVRVWGGTLDARCPKAI